MITETIYLSYLSALIEGDKKECTSIVKELLDKNIDTRKLYVELFQRSLYRIGKLWEMNRISVATEHLATDITQNLMILAFANVKLNGKIGKRIVITCIDKEFHQIGARMVADVFELNGWDSYFLGANTPPGEVVKFIEEKKPDLIGLSLNLYINVVRLFKMIEAIRKYFPDLPIIVGGQALSTEGKDSFKQFEKVQYIETFEELDKKIFNVVL